MSSGWVQRGESAGERENETVAKKREAAVLVLKRISLETDKLWARIYIFSLGFAEPNKWVQDSGSGVEREDGAVEKITSRLPCSSLKNCRQRPSSRGLVSTFARLFAPYCRNGISRANLRGIR